MRYRAQSVIRLAALVLSSLLLLWPMWQSGRTREGVVRAMPALGASRELHAAMHYVSPTGSDKSDGSLSHPWATIQHADRLVQPGDTVVVMNGTYFGDILLRSSGTADRPITYVAQDKWQAKLVGTTSGAGTAIIRITGGHLIIKNFDITGTDANGIILAASGTSASFNQAIGNYVHDLTTPCDQNGGAGLDTGGGDNYQGISHDDFIGNVVVNIHRILGCTTSVPPSGIYEAVPYGVVANNIVINGGYVGIQSWHAASNLTFFGNTVMNNYRDGIIVGAGDSGSSINDYTLVQNNICINNGYAGIIEEGPNGVHNQYKNNLGYKNVHDFVLGNHLQCINCLSNTNPEFINNTGTAAGNYGLQSNSPARGKGLALAGINSDYLEQARPQAGTTDIGAVVYTKGAAHQPDR